MQVLAVVLKVMYIPVKIKLVRWGWRDGDGHFILLV